MEHGVWGFVANGFLEYAFQAVSNKHIKVKESNDNLQNTPFLSPLLAKMSAQKHAFGR